MTRFLAKTVRFLLAVSFFALSGTVECSTPDPQAPPSQGAVYPDTPSIQVPDPNHHFGEVLEGAEVVHEFTVRNTGKAVLNIREVRPG